MNFKEILTPECLFKEIKNGPDTSAMASNPELFTTVCGVPMKKYGQNSESTKSSSVEILPMTTNFLTLSSTKPLLELICHAINYKKPVLIKGPVGSGKSAMVQHVVNSVGRISPPSFVTVQLGEHMDSRSLFGTYQCTEVPGEFVWKPGSLTKAVCDGHWILLEDLHCAPLDVLSSLTLLLETRTINLPNLGLVSAHDGFQMFATWRTDNFSVQSSQDLISTLLNKSWFSVEIEPLTDENMKQILTFLHPNLNSIMDRLLETFKISRSSLFLGVENRQIAFRDLMKWCRRISSICSLDDPVTVFNEASDCFVGHLRKLDNRRSAIFTLAANLNVTKEKADYYFSKHKPSINLSENSISVGRSSLSRFKNIHFYKSENFAFTRLSSMLLERLAVCVQVSEPVLLVGETGCGKTTAVQFLAKCIGKTLHVVNMNQQSENSDLMGGFKPVDMQHTIKNVKEKYLNLFKRTFSVVKNEKFLNHVQTCFARYKYDELIQLMIQTTMKAIVRPTTTDEWKFFSEDLTKVQRILKRCDDGLMFNFVEGVLTKALKNGDWILLDEINLSSSETLDCLYTILDSQSRNLVLVDQSDSEPLKIHPEFRLFACMNPCTDIGKKELPIGVRNRFTEFFVDDVLDAEDLMILVESYLRGLSLTSDQLNRIVAFYLASKSSLTKGNAWGYSPTCSLRTLCRALSYTRSNPCGNVIRSLYEGFCLSFLTELDSKSYTTTKKMIQDYIIGKNPATVKSLLSQQLPQPSVGSFIKVQGYWIECGNLIPVNDEKYVLTSAVKRNLTDVARIVSAKSYPVLLQGETSVGKTSLIKYLAKITGNYCVRINNHEHTDVQEYVGTYATDSSGKLKFVEGPLVQAMKKGHWIILDELNLAPPDILEALNRVLDDNRELFLSETQEVVKAHPNFLLFATQNPPGLYGGRKQLSRAFRNRFVELHFDELPFVELEQILHLRCSLPMSYAKKMVKTMQELQVYRSSSGVFAGRESYMTLRDLFRWGERYKLTQVAAAQNFFDWDQYLTDQGYLLLAGRSRRVDDQETVCSVLQKQFGRQIDVESLFALSSPYTLINFKQIVPGFEHIVWTFNLRRSAVLAGQALLYNEPVLLIGDTGCGKTTLCQLFARIKEKQLHSINCHMMTEAADFLGRIAPSSSEQMARGVLFEWRDGPLILAMQNGEPILIDEISLADDSVLERLNSVLEPERQLLLAEIGVDDNGLSRSLEANDGFQILATMNPGGDYGKKELSRALRNRFTEIWCETYYDKTDFVSIIEHNVKQGLSLGNQQDGTSGFGRAMFDFAFWLKNNCPTHVKLVITIRDVLSWVSFINSCSEFTDCALAFVHGAFLTFLDGLGCSSTGCHDQERARLVDASFQFLAKQVEKLSGYRINRAEIEHGSSTLRFENGKFGTYPFFIDAGSQNIGQLKNYSFDAPTCSSNVFRILRAMQVGKPVLLEGDPGVGKSSIVSALAKSSANNLTRINLSDQTDLSDLFGSDIPILLPNGNQGFAWVDGPLLEAIKNGHWILIDEMNLASQAVLEGLNACFDHRKEIFIPQLARSFNVDCSKTKFFACQNPFGQGAGRKGLPKSFLNRFSVVYVEPLNADDMFMILNASFPGLGENNLRKMIKFNQNIVEEIVVQRKWGQIGSPWEFNLRDLMRWCHLTEKNYTDPSQFVDLIYSDRMRTKNDRLEVKKCFENVFECSTRTTSLMYQITSDFVQFGDAFIESRVENELGSIENGLVLLRTMLKPMRSLIHCVNSNYLTILIGKSGTGKTSLVKTLAKLCGRNLRSFYLNSETDSSDLLGCFEQKFSNSELVGVQDSLSNICEEIKNDLFSLGLNQTAEIISSLMSSTTELYSLMNVFEKLHLVCNELDPDRKSKYCSELAKLKDNWNQINSKSNSVQFTWIDSPLVEALRSGDWLLVKNVHCCNPAVLDRLNALLEPDGVLTVAEKGLVDGILATYRPHPDFRIFFTCEPGHQSISRAMRNRGIEIFIPSEDTWLHDRNDCLSVLMTNSLVDNNLANSIWTGLQNLKMKGIDFTSFDVLKVAFIASQSLKSGVNLIESAKLAFERTLGVHLQHHELIEDPIDDHYLIVAVDWHRKNNVLSSFQKDSSFLNCVFKDITDEKRLSSFLKHYLWNSTLSDWSFRLKIIKKILKTKSGSLKQTFKQYEPILSCVHDFRTNFSEEFNDFSCLPFDSRWCGELFKILSRKLELTSRNMLISNSNKLSVYLTMQWFSVVETSAAQPKSLLSMADSVVKGSTSVERLPDKSLKYLPSFFNSFQNLIKDLLTTADFDKNFNDSWFKLLRCIFYLKRFSELCRSSATEWNEHEHEIRIVWRYFVKFFDHSMFVYKPFDDVCKQLIDRWLAEPVLTKLYQTILKKLNMSRPFETFEEMKSVSDVERILTTINKDLCECFANGDERKAEFLIEQRVKIFTENKNENVEKLFLEANKEFSTTNVEEINSFKPLQKDLLSNVFVAFVHCLSFDSSSPDNERRLHSTAVILQTFCALTSSTLNEFDSKSFPSKFLNFSAYLNQNCTLQKITTDEDDSIHFKIANLCQAPVVPLVVKKFFNENYSSPDVCNVALLHVNDFKENLIYFESFLWSVGCSTFGIEKILKQRLIAGMDQLYVLLTDCFSLSDSHCDQLQSIVERMKIIKGGSLKDFVRFSLNIGYILCSLTAPPLKSTDHVLKSIIKSNLRKNELDETERELATLDRYHFSLTNQHFIDGDVDVDSFHPFAKSLIEIKTELKMKLSIKFESFYRPKVSQFTLLVRELRSFMTTCENYISYFEADSSSSSIVELKHCLKKLQSFSQSADHFNSSLKNDYASYRDVVDPFLLGINLIRLSNCFYSYDVNKRLTALTFSQTTNVNVDEMETFCTALVNVDSEKIIHLIRNSNLINSLSTQDLLRILEIITNDKNTNRESFKFCLEYFFNIYGNWVQTERTDDDRYYEYKSKTLTSVDDQEAIDMKQLFTDFDNADAVGDDALPSNKLDEERFVVTFTNFMQRSTTTSEAQRRWFNYFVVSSVLNRWNFLFPSSYLMDAHLLAMNFGRNRFENGDETKTLNVYKDSSLTESSKLIKLLNDLIKKVETILVEWPENPILIELLSTTKKVLTMPANTPLIKLAAALEKLLDEANEWETVAARVYKLEIILQPIRSLLLNWRKMEVNGWEKLLDDVDNQYESESYLCVLKFGLVINSWKSGIIPTPEFLKNFTNLLAFCPLGEFDGRLNAIRFICNLYFDENHIETKIICENYCRYFACYRTKVAEKIRRCREPIEKELKEFLKIVKFQDLNLWRLKDTAQRAHRQLFKLVRNYKESIQTPVSVCFNELVVFPSVQLNFCSSMIENHIQKDSYGKKCIQFLNEIRTVLTSTNDDIVSVVDQTIDAAKEISVSLMKQTTYLGTKEEKEKLYKRTLIGKQKLVNDYFDILRRNGLSYRKGSAIAKETIENDIFKTLSHSDDDNWQKSDELFWIAVSRKGIFDAVAEKPHEQLHRPTIERCSGYARHLASLIIQYKSNMVQSLNHRDRLQRNLAALRVAEVDASLEKVNSSQSAGRHFYGVLSSVLQKVKGNLARSLEIWNCCPSSADVERWNTPILREITPKLCQFSADKYEFKMLMGKLNNVFESICRCESELESVGESSTNLCDYLSSSSISNIIQILKEATNLIPAIVELLNISSSPDDESRCFLSQHLHASLISLQMLRSDFESTVSDSKLHSLVDEGRSEKSKQAAGFLRQSVFLRTQQIYKIVANFNSPDDDTSLFDLLARNFSVLRSLDCQEVLQNVENLRSYFCDGFVCDPYVVDLLAHYISVADNVRSQLWSNFVKFCTFYATTLEGWITLMNEGYIKPIPDLEKSDGGEGETKFEDMQDAGMGEGEGAKDVSEEIKDLGQVDDLKNNETNEEKNDEKQMDDVDKPIEMDEDMDAAMEDLKLDESNSDSDGDENEEPDVDWKAGEAGEPQEEQLDPKLWEDREDEENPSLDDKTDGADEKQDQLAAKENEKNVEGAETDEPKKDDVGSDDEEDDKLDEDLENINLEDINKSDDDENGEDGEENVEKVEETNEEQQDELAELEQDEKRIEDKSQTSTKSISQSGVGGNENDESVENSCQEPLESSANEEEQKKDETDENASKTPNDENASSATSSSQKDLPVKRRNTETESNRRDADETLKKRPRVNDEEKSFGDPNADKMKNVDVTQNALDTEASESETNKPSEVFSHYPNLGPSGLNVLDAATLDVARRQIAEKESVEMTDETKVDERENIETLLNEKENLPMAARSNEIIAQESMDADVVDVEMNDDETNPKDFSSSVHTVMDFYTHASSSKALLDLANVDDDRFLVSDQTSSDQCKVLWTTYATVMQPLAAELSENLRLTLEPTLATKFQGDYRSGKRLNIRKLIPYIASYFRKNKIWLRRTKKAKRDYQIMLAIDDSSSMNDNKTKQLAFESLALLSNALRYLEIGQLGVCKFGHDTQLLHPFYEQFNDDSGANVINRLTFEQKNTNIVALMDFCSAYLDKHSFMASAKRDLPAQLLLIVSDGRGIFAQGMEKVKQAVRNAMSRRIFVVFIVLDNPEHKNSILDIKVPIFEGTSVPEIRPYMEFFPFSFYVVLRQINALPAILGEALRQWFEILAQ